MDNYRILKVNYTDIVISDISNSTGAKSITNSAEEVVKELCQLFDHNKKIMYYDSDGNLGELVHENGVFKNFGSPEKQPQQTAR